MRTSYKRHSDISASEIIGVFTGRTDLLIGEDGTAVIYEDVVLPTAAADLRAFEPELLDTVIRALDCAAITADYMAVDFWQGNARKRKKVYREEASQMRTLRDRLTAKVSE